MNWRINIAFITLSLLFAVTAQAQSKGGNNTTSNLDEQVQDADTHGKQPLRKCTNAILSGGYGYSATGMVAGVGAFAAVGVLTAHGDGTLSGRITHSVNGVIIPPSPLSGTYTVNEDCTGTAVFSRGGPADFVIVDRGRELHFIQTTPGTVITGVV